MLLGGGFVEEPEEEEGTGGGSDLAIKMQRDIAEAGSSLNNHPVTEE